VLEERVRSLEDAGFRIAGITSDVSTLGAAFREEDEALVMDTGERHTLFVLYRSGLPVLLRKIPIGIHHMKEASEAGSGDGLLQLGAEIKRTLHSFNARIGLEVNRLHVTGNLLRHETSLRALQGQARTEITLRSPRDYPVSVEEAPDSTDANVFASLIGSAFWRRKDGFFNFLGEGLVREERAGLSSRRAVAWGWGFVAAALLLLLLSYGLDLAALQARRDFLKSEMRNTFTSAFPRVTRVVDELKQARNLLNAERSALAGGNPQGGVPLIAALRAISAAIPETVPFQIESLFWESGRFEINARTDSFKTVNTIQELLSGSNEIAQAAISNARHRQEGEDVEFKLSVRFAG
jgi:Tfp pilus assembly protein PilN